MTATTKQVEYKVNDKVLVLFDAPAKGPLMPRWEGPFIIKNKHDAVTYRVENKEKLISVHVRRMCRYHDKNNR